LNTAAALERHVPPEKLAALERFEGSALFTEREKAALAYAQAATDPRTPVDDACRARLRAHFDQQAIVELTALIAFQNMSSKFNAALGVPARGFCQLQRR
jgi:alkylhydroperoxidase family enzyme